MNRICDFSLIFFLLNQLINLINAIKDKVIVAFIRLVKFGTILFVCNVIDYSSCSSGSNMSVMESPQGIEHGAMILSNLLAKIRCYLGC